MTLLSKAGIGGILGPGCGERGEKAAHCGAEAGAGYIDFHGGAVDRRDGGADGEVSPVSEARPGTPSELVFSAVLMRGSPGLRES